MIVTNLNLYLNRVLLCDKKIFLDELKLLYLNRAESLML